MLFLGKKLELFRARYPKIKIRLTSLSTSQAVNSLANNLVDFSIVLTPVRLPKNFSSYTLHEFGETLIAGYKFKDKITRVCSLSEINHYSFASMDTDTSTYEYFVKFFMDINLEYKPMMFVATTDQILFIIKHNLAIGFYPDQLAKEEIRLKNVVEIPLSETLPKRQILLVTDRNKPLSTAASKFVEMLKE